MPQLSNPDNKQTDKEKHDTHLCVCGFRSRFEAVQKLNKAKCAAVSHVRSFFKPNSYYFTDNEPMFLSLEIKKKYTVYIEGKHIKSQNKWTDMVLKENNI